MRPASYARAMKAATGRLLRKVLKAVGPRAPRSSTSAPTFPDFIDRRHEWLFANLPTESAKYLHDLHPKDKQKAMAKRLGLAVADEYLTRVSLNEALEFMNDSPLTSFVLKPVAASSAAGVLAVIKEGSNYRDVKSKKLYRPEALRQEAMLGYARLKRPDLWMVEELLLPTDGSLRVIDDIKFFCFAGRTELILQKGEADIGGKKKYGIRFYDRGWSPVTTGLRPKMVLDQLSPPADAARFMEVAEAAASKLPIPFIRIDLYASHRGPVLGELTPGPGGTRRLNQEWTQRFTKRWLEAAEAVASGLAAGEIEPMYPEHEIAKDVPDHDDETGDRLGVDLAPEPVAAT